MASLQDIALSAFINILSAFVFFVAFAILRLQPFNDRIYFPKWHLKGIRSSPRHSGKTVTQFVNLDWRTYLRFLNWMPAALRMPEPELIDHAGLDSAVYIRIYLLGLKIFVPLSVLAFGILVPVNWTGDTLEHLDVEFSDIDKLSISNVAKESKRLWAHLVMAYIFTFWIYYALYKEYKIIATMRLHFLASENRRPDQFTVGAKSNNIEYLRGRVPSWIKVPTSVALPFGVFEASISAEVNKDLAKKISFFNGLVNGGDIVKLQMIQDAILEMKAPFQLISELKYKMRSSKLCWPGDEGEERWNQAWKAVKKVWASKWNERAYVSCRKAKLNHDDLCMAVLVQEVINADYAFVSHTRNPISGNPSEIYTEIVKGLGETLVGAYPGRAMSFIAKKSALQSPNIISFPSKPVGMFIKKSLIFRSDSNGEDLEGYAGAGLYDSVTMDKMEKVVLDYSCDPLICDKSYQQSIFKRIAEAGKIVEDIFGSAQDIEGVVKDAEIYIVQTRPQI